ncbi:MAG: DUF4388 domain-containing protein [Chloroflexota bacterium]|nr:DUF4388 domain-containing protein [Chloroflexota bacterium]
MAELQGSLGGLGLPAIVQLIGELHQSGNLELTRNGSCGVLGFDDGRLVAASYNTELHGLQALAACTLELVEGEFLFVEGTPVGERTLDLSGSDLQKLFDRIAAGEVAADSLGLRPANADDSAAPETCPLLGFMDDASRHYSRPTALHRCYASGAPALVSGQEQRDLCLSGRFSTCPRFRNASTTNSVGTAPAPAPVARTPVSTPRAAASPRGVPAGVSARMAAASQMHAPDASPPTGEAASTGMREYDPDVLHTAPPPDRRFRLRSQRGLSLVAIRGLVGLVVLVVGAFLVFAFLMGGFGQPTASVAVQSEPASTLPGVVTSIPRPTPDSGSLAKPVTASSSPVPQTAAPVARTLPGALPAQSSPSTAPAAVSTAPPAVAIGVPTLPPAPTAGAAAAPAPGQMLVDVRFASGPQQGWLDNPPYAMWSDGAYRLRAAQVAHFVAVSAPILAPLSDVVVSATLRKTGGPPGGGYGLVVRTQSPDSLNGVNQDARAYVFEAGDRGEFGIWRRDGDHWVDLVPWTRSESVRPGGSPNDVEVRAVGDQLTFSVNGAELAAIQDDRLASGGVGVFVGGDYNEVALDRFVAQVPD